VASLRELLRCIVPVVEVACAVSSRVLVLLDVVLPVLGFETVLHRQEVQVSSPVIGLSEEQMVWALAVWQMAAVEVVSVVVAAVEEAEAVFQMVAAEEVVVCFRAVVVVV